MIWPPMGAHMRWWPEPTGEVHPTCKKFGHAWNYFQEDMPCVRIGCEVHYRDTVVEVKGAAEFEKKWERSHP